MYSTVCFMLLIRSLATQSSATTYVTIFLISYQIADKLLASFGQDVLDALYWTATEPKGRKREHAGIIPHLVLSLIYVCILLERDDNMLRIR